MLPEQYQRLLQKYVEETLTEQEFYELWDTLQQPEYQEEWVKFTGALWNTATFHQLADEQTKAKVWEQIRQGEGLGKQVSPVIPMQRTPFFRRYGWAAAILFLILAGGAIYNWTARRPGKEPLAVSPVKRDIAPPSGNKAVLTLSGGRQVILDSAANGALATQDAIRVQKLNAGEIVYQAAPAGLTTLLYNTLTVPRGSKVVTLTLSDGTRIWLNAASSLTYPIAFIGADRTVTVTGEAYFEIARNASKPFKVKVNGKMEVDVLGTGFNINAYEDEEKIQTTLLEGSIRVSTTNSDVPAERQQKILTPGQQALVGEGGSETPSGRNMKVVSDADTEGAVAWKNGLFAFTDADLQTVMRQLARWYDVEVSYEGIIPKRAFNGKIGKGLPLSEVLDGLARSRVHYTILPGNKIIIRP